MDAKEKELRTRHEEIYSEWHKWRQEEFKKIREPYNRDVLPLVNAYKAQYKDYCERVNAKHEEMLGELVAKLDEYN